MAIHQGLHLLHSSRKTASTTMVCKLRISLYDLKQAPRQWFTMFSVALREFGLLVSHSDSSLFVRASKTEFISLLFYVDDIIVTRSSTSLILQLKKFLHSKFTLKDMGPLKYILGLEFSRSKQGIYLHQRKYTLDTIKDVSSSFPPFQNPNGLTSHIIQHN